MTFFTQLKSVLDVIQGEYQDLSHYQMCLYVCTHAEVKLYTDDNHLGNTLTLCYSSTQLQFYFDFIVLCLLDNEKLLTLIDIRNMAFFMEAHMCNTGSCVCL